MTWTCPECGARLISDVTPEHVACGEESMPTCVGTGKPLEAGNRHRPTEMVPDLPGAMPVQELAWWLVAEYSSYPAWGDCPEDERPSWRADAARLTAHLQTWKPEVPR